MITSVLLFLLAMGVILGGAAIFTNGVEWLGRRLGISDGAIGSILAGIATALPETLIPVIAIFFGESSTEVEIGIGAILGAPLMLSALIIPLLAGFLLMLKGMGRRASQFELDYRGVRLDLGFFLVGYGLAFIVGQVPLPPVRYAAALALLLIYAWYVKIHVTTGEVSQMEIAPLYFARRAGRPPTGLVVAQSVTGLAFMIGGAHLFVHVVKDIAVGMGISPMVLSLLVAPLATELPETVNSFLWVYQKKDTLALGNITGAMVFQGTFPVSVGLIGTSWNLDAPALLSLTIPILATVYFVAHLRLRGAWEPRLLVLPALLYAGYMAFAFLR